MKERVYELVRLLRETKVAEKIATSDNPLEEYMIQKEEFSDRMYEFVGFVKSYEFDTDEYFAYEISPEEAPSWALLFIMTGLYEEDIALDYTVLDEALTFVEGELEEVAEKMKMFLYTSTWSLHEEEELINLLFVK